MENKNIPSIDQYEMANYKKQLVEDFEGNPLIEALPQILNAKDMLQVISTYPKYDKKEREKDASIRLHSIDRIDNVVVPLVEHYKIAINVSTTLRQGYIARNPMSPENIRKRNILSDILQNKCVKDKFNEMLICNNQIKKAGMGFLIMGISGVGKSTTIKRIMSGYPQVIRHTKYNDREFFHTQITWIKVECPIKGSVKSLCQNFFTAIDGLLFTSYFDKYGSNRNSRETMMAYMQYLSELYSIGIIFVDEMQNLVDSKDVAVDIINFLVALDNTIGVPIVYICTFKAQPLLNIDLRITRRICGSGEIPWERMKNDFNWKEFLKGIWRYQWTSVPVELTDEIVNLFYDKTQGIIKLAVKLYELTQKRAILSGNEVITYKLIEMVAEREMPMTTNMIKALKSGDYESLSQYDDICSNSEILRAYGKKKTKKKLTTNFESEIEEFSTERDLLKNKIILHLYEKQIDYAISAKVAKTVVEKSNDNTTLDQLLNESLKLALALQIKQQEETISDSVVTNEINKAHDEIVATRDEKDLIEIFKSNNESDIYEVLINKGLIKNDAFSI